MYVSFFVEILNRWEILISQGYWSETPWENYWIGRATSRRWNARIVQKPRISFSAGCFLWFNIRFWKLDPFCWLTITITDKSFSHCGFCKLNNKLELYKGMERKMEANNEDSFGLQANLQNTLEAVIMIFHKEVIIFCPVYSVFWGIRSDNIIFFEERFANQEKYRAATAEAERDESVDSLSFLSTISRARNRTCEEMEHAESLFLHCFPVLSLVFWITNSFRKNATVATKWMIGLIEGRAWGNQSEIDGEDFCTGGWTQCWFSGPNIVCQLTTASKLSLCVT